MSREKGNIAENKASNYLLEKGYEIVDRNVYSRFGELDIIAMKENVLHFVEVKSGEDYEKAIQNITPSKLSKLIKTANVYMKKHSFEGDYTFDAVIVTPEDIEMVEDITL
jgi:putative endonuclease